MSLDVKAETKKSEWIGLGLSYWSVIRLAGIWVLTVTAQAEWNPRKGYTQSDISLVHMRKSRGRGGGGGGGVQALQDLCDISLRCWLNPTAVM